MIYMNIKLEDKVIIIAGPNCSYKNELVNILEEQIDNSITISCLENDMLKRINFFNEIANNLVNNDKTLILNTLSVEAMHLENIIMFLNEIDYTNKINILKLNLPNIYYIRDNIKNVFNTINEIKIYNSDNGSLNNKFEDTNEYIIDNLENINIEQKFSNSRTLTRNNCMV